MTALPVAYGQVAQGETAALEEAVAAGDHEAVIATALRLAEHGVFRLAGLAFAAWWADGAPGREAWTIPADLRAYTLGHAREALTFCSARTPLLPDGDIPVPACVRLAAAVDALAAACRGRTRAEVQGRRFPLAAMVAGAGAPRRTGRTLPAVIDQPLARLRNLHAHPAGRSDPWPDRHPEYAATMAPLVAAAVAEVLGHPGAVAALHGLMVAHLDHASRVPGRPPRTMLTFAPDAAGLRAAYCNDGAGLSGLPGRDSVSRRLAALPAADLDEVRPPLVVRVGSGAEVAPLWPFFDLAAGVPVDPIDGEPLVLR